MGKPGFVTLSTNLPASGETETTNSYTYREQMRGKRIKKMENITFAYVQHIIGLNAEERCSSVSVCTCRPFPTNTPFTRSSKHRAGSSSYHIASPSSQLDRVNGILNWPYTYREQTPRTTHLWKTDLSIRMA